MKISENIFVTKTKQGEYWCNLVGSWVKYSTSPEIDALAKLYETVRKKSSSELDRMKAFSEVKNVLTNRPIDEMDDELSKAIKAEQDKAIAEGAIQELINFFSEFSFEPNFRFINTLAYKCKTNKDAKDYITNYFALTDSCYKMSIVEKMKSDEFNQIVTKLSTVKPTKVINNRFKLYYGSQGTGKTTKAMQEADNNVMVCHSAMLPSDLMEDFKFNDGKAAFAPSALCDAITEGKAIVLDEINLLPFESLRFLQSLLDGKSQFVYKGQTINIKDGFKIIGTMNLKVNGMTYALPEPLVDRAEDLKEFRLTAKNLIGAII